MAYPYYPYTSAYPYLQQQAQAQPQTLPQIQSGGVVHATEAEARKYPVAPGYSVIFIDDEQKMLYTKTAGFSQLDAPVFEKYRLTKENRPTDEPGEAGKAETPPYATKAEFEALRGEFEAFCKEMKSE